MATARLTDRRIRKIAKPGKYPDGDGLFLQVAAQRTGGLGRSWFVRLRLPDGRTREMGLGAYETVPLAEARAKAREARIEAKAGRDPIAAKNEARRLAKREQTPAMTFRHCAESCIAARATTWRNEKHAAQWTSTLVRYVYPVFGDLPVAAINTPLVIRALDPIWTVKNETARRVRQRIEVVLDWAKTRGHRTGENPAVFKANLALALPTRPVRTRRTHFNALPFADMPSFWAELANREGTGAEALRFAILTAARTGEVVGARWEEIDRKAGVWSVPGARMKGGRDHRVPLSEPALAILAKLAGPEAGPVFRAGRAGVGLSNMALLKTLHRMGRADITVHGMRSCFRDWAAERTQFPREVAEMALAHAIRDAAEAAYRRGDLFEKRRKLMDAWGAYCTSVEARGNVVNLRRHSESR